MYNRYIFSPDGSCRRDQILEAPDPPSSVSSVPERKAQEKSCNASCPFLQGLLPTGFDTGDLIVVLLLLLMAGDSREERDTALLTLVLYFIL